MTSSSYFDVDIWILTILNTRDLAGLARTVRPAQEAGTGGRHRRPAQEAGVNGNELAWPIVAQ